MGHRPAPGGPHAHAVAQPRSPVSAPDVALRSEGPRVTPGSPAQGPSAGKRRPHNFRRGKPVGPPTGRGHRGPPEPQAPRKGPACELARSQALTPGPGAGAATPDEPGADGERLGCVASGRGLRASRQGPCVQPSSRVAMGGRHLPHEEPSPARPDRNPHPANSAASSRRLPETLPSRLTHSPRLLPQPSLTGSQQGTAVLWEPWAFC